MLKPGSQLARRFVHRATLATEPRGGRAGVERAWAA
jgi:hypothetical protein